MEIAVIDDGINENVYGTATRNNIAVDRKLKMYERKNYDSYSKSHGSICAAIINKYCSGISFNSIKILDDNSRKAKSRQLIKAIEWCIENEIKLVNMSIGSIDYKDRKELQKVVNIGSEKGVIFVAACNNNGALTYPASLMNVIGVRCDKDGFLNGIEYLFIERPIDGVDVIACGKHELTDYTGRASFCHASNSFAAPVVTAIVGNILMKNPEINCREVKKILLKDSYNELYNNKRKRYEYTNIVKYIDWVSKAAIIHLCDENAIRTKKFNVSYGFEVIDEICIKWIDASDAIDRIKKEILKYKNVEHNLKFIIIYECYHIHAEFEKMKNQLKFIDMCEILYIDHNNLLHGYRKNPDNQKDFSFINMISGMNICFDEQLIEHNMNHNLKNCEAPYISLYDFTSLHMLYIMDVLANYFKKDGYDACKIANTCIGVIAGVHYLPFDNYVENDKYEEEGSLKKAFDIIRYAYRPSVFISGFDTNINGWGYFEKYEDEVGSDIVIIVLNSKSDDIINYLKLFEGKKVIIFTPDRKCYRILKYYKDKMPDVKVINSIKSAYKYIIKLLEN